MFFVVQNWQFALVWPIQCFLSALGAGGYQVIMICAFGDLMLH